jgi:putative transposase
MILNVHYSGYYAWLKQPESQRERNDKHLLRHIKQYWLESGGHYGYRNIYLDLNEAGIRCGRDKVLRLMQQAGLRAARGYKSPKGYYSGKPATVTPNILQREFTVNAPNQWWVSDITYIHTNEGFLFLAVIMDLYARNIVGWSMSDRMTDALVLDALTMAYWRRRPKQTVKFHSDQGSQYSSRNFRSLLSNLNIEPSMSRRGNCWDNAVAESFFSNLKKEQIRRIKYKTRGQARQAMFHYIEMFYNPKRRHTNNDRLSPNEYERRYFQSQKSV